MAVAGDRQRDFLRRAIWLRLAASSCRLAAMELILKGYT
jgi:hypothetical protein